MALTRLIYASQPFGFDDAMLNGILVEARRNNAKLDVTGCLICRSDLYLQLLEGPTAAIETIYARIEADDRHLAIRCLNRAQTATRMFPDWAMRDDPARSWLWSPAEVEAGAVDAASEAELLAVFARVGA